MVERSGVVPAVRINTAVLDAVLAAVRRLARQIEASPPSLDGLLAIKGVMEIGEVGRERRGAAQRRGRGHRPASRMRSARWSKCVAARAPRLAGADAAARRDRRAAAARRGHAWPQARGDPGAARRADRDVLVGQSDRFDPDRLHQEAILIATKADVREELDRLTAHVAQAQEPHRPGRPDRPPRSTFLPRSSIAKPIRCCAKANDVELTNIGLELKAAVEQFREQVQNVE